MLSEIKCKTIYEFVMWENCNNNCDFCFLRFDPQYKNKLLDDEEKISAIDCVIKYLKSENYEKGSHVLIAGGELFFNKFTSSVYSKFKELSDLIINYIKNGYIDILYLNSNLIYEDLFDLKNLILYPLRDNNLLSHIHFTTSYDRYGRFKTQDKLNLFLNNLRNIVTEFEQEKDFLVYTNCILTSPLCMDILNRSFDRKEFIKEFKNKLYVNFLPYVPFDKNLEADDNLIFKTMLFIKNDDEMYFKNYIENFLLDQKRIVFEYDKSKNTLLDHTSEINPKCGHLKSFTKYRDEEKCLLCNYKKIKDALL